MRGRFVSTDELFGCGVSRLAGRSLASHGWLWRRFGLRDANAAGEVSHQSSLNRSILLQDNPFFVNPILAGRSCINNQFLLSQRRQ
ncbi:MAG: hypothetical protein MZU95_12145 [Desulfomicrobium escambiense]|nr:hypothetical protein [Desulfomicrobium escambiense]